jgi:hypothetical protein
LHRDLISLRRKGARVGVALNPGTSLEVLDYIIEEENPNTKLSIGINTNLGVPDALIDKFIAKAKIITDQDKVKEFVVYTSVEAKGAQAEYTRFGLDYEKFWENVDKILTELPKVTINIMATFNALSVFSYDHLLDRIFEMKKKHHNGKRYKISAVSLDTSYLRWPSHLSVKILEDKDKELILNSAKKALYYGMKEYHQDNYGFSNVEIQKIKRIYDYAIGKSMFSVDKFRKEFVTFVDQLDERRGTNFQETFPELKEFYAKHKRG